MAERPSRGTVDRLRYLLPYRILIPVALLLGLAPFRPEPHLMEKVRMLVAGSLRRPIDVFDLFLHGLPVALVIVRLGGDALARIARGPTTEGKS